MAKQAPKKKGANGYKLPDPLPKGEILVDIAKKSWKLGASIGQGGFGEIYSAQEADTKSANYPYVVKIEPHENGPLFVEINFYIRNAKPQEVEDFKNKKKLKMLGIPTYLGSGSHEHKNQKYRFLVMHKFGTDIWKLFLENGRIFPILTVFKLGVQILDALEYIHDHGYVHADIKGANILLGLSKETQNQTYLVDFGLATKFQTGGEFKPNPKKAHDGTIEYLSRDAHQGVATRRGDLEILAYNMIQWLGCNLPWESNLSNPVNVQESKEQSMKDIPTFLKKCFGSKSTPDVLPEFLKYIKNLSFDEKPNYTKIRKMFISEIENNGGMLTSPLVFKIGKQSSPSKRKVDQKKTNTKKLKKEEGEDNISNGKQLSPSKRKVNQKTTNMRKLKKEESDEDNDLDEKIVEKTEIKKPKSKPVTKIVTGLEFEGYTPEMKAIALKRLNGVKKTLPKKIENGNKNLGVSEMKNGETNIGRSRRNTKAVNYNESAT